MINLPYLLQWQPFVSLIKRICISAPVYFSRKEFWFAFSYFLSLLSIILQAQSGLRSQNFTCPVRILQVSDIGLVLSFEDCPQGHVMSVKCEEPIDRARNSRLQTHKMRVEIQVCELKIYALEKSCEFDISSNTKTSLRSCSQRWISQSIVKAVEKLKHLVTKTLAMPWHKRKKKNAASPLSKKGRKMNQVPTTRNYSH